MMRVTSYDVIFIEVYIKVPAQYYLTEPALGGYTSLLKSTWLYLQSPCSLLHNDPALGGYTGWSFYEHKAITSPRLLQAWQPGTWGLHVWNIQFMTNSQFGVDQINPVSATIMTRHQLFITWQFWQSSARSTSLSRLNISWIFQDYYFCQIRAMKAESNGLFLIIFLYKNQC